MTPAPAALPLLLLPLLPAADVCGQCLPERLTCADTPYTAASNFASAAAAAALASSGTLSTHAPLTPCRKPLLMMSAGSSKSLPLPLPLQPGLPPLGRADAEAGGIRSAAAAAEPRADTPPMPLPLPLLLPTPAPAPEDEAASEAGAAAAAPPSAWNTRPSLALLQLLLRLLLPSVSTLPLLPLLVDERMLIPLPADLPLLLLLMLITVPWLSLLRALPLPLAEDGVAEAEERPGAAADDDDDEDDDDEDDAPLPPSAPDTERLDIAVEPNTGRLPDDSEPEPEPELDEEAEPEPELVPEAESLERRLSAPSIGSCGRGGFASIVAACPPAPAPAPADELELEPAPAPPAGASADTDFTNSNIRLNVDPRPPDELLVLAAMPAADA